jgi:hypothetical protein
VHDALHEDTGRVHQHRVQRPRLDELLHRRDGDPAGRGAERVEVLRALLVDEVAVPVAVPRVHQREVGGDRLLEHVVAVAEAPDLLRLGGEGDGPVSVVAAGQAAVGHLRPDAARCEEGGDAGAAGAQPLGEGALRHQLDLELAGEELPLELLVLADVGPRRTADPLGREQRPQAPLVDAAVVGHRRQVGGARLQQRLDERLRDAAQTEPPDRERGPVRDVRDGLGGAADHLVHVLPPTLVSDP